jgi:L-lactate dehydrogenase complex protein LldG
MTARSAILQSLRATRPDAASPRDIAAESDACAAAMRKTLPPLAVDDLPGLFAARASAEKVGATVERVAALADLPAAVGRYIAENVLTPSFALQPDPRLQKLDWGGLRPNEILRPNTVLSVGLALCGVAETGSLVFHSAPTAPTLFAYLPIHHVVALDAQSLYLRLEDYATGVKGRASPRNVNLITGASGTTDIEGVLTRGAHGPSKLHIVIYG